MRRKLVWLLVGLLVGTGVAAATMVNAAGSKSTQIQQGTDGDHENEGTEVDDANEPEDNDGAGDIEDSDAVEHEHEGTEGADDADEPGDHDGAGTSRTATSA
jgi:hypothetical protein